MPFAEKAKPAPHNGGIVPPFCDLEKGMEIVKRCVYLKISWTKDRRRIPIIKTKQQRNILLHTLPE